MTPTTRRIPNVIALFGLILLAGFTWVEKGPSRAVQWPWYLYAQALLVLPALWLVAHASIHRRLVRFGGALDFGLLGFAAAMVAAAVAAAKSGASLAMLPAVLVPVTTAYAVLNALAESPTAQSRRDRLAEIGAALLALTSFITLLAWIWNIVIPIHTSGITWGVSFSVRNERILGHSVYNAGVGLLTFAWLAGLARERAGRARLLLLTGAAIGFGLLLSSGSRGGFIGLAAWLVWLLLAEARRRRWTPTRTLPVLLLCAAAAGTLIGLHPRTRGLVRQWRDSGALNSGDRQRLAMAEFGRFVLQDHPFLGIGPGTTPLEYPRYRARLSGGVEAALQLHSTPVQWAADAGLAGLAAATVLSISLLWRRRRRTPTFASGALLAYAVFALTDYQLDIPVFAFATGVLLALVAHSGRELQPAPLGDAAAPPGVVRPLPTALAVAGLLLVHFGVQFDPLRARAAFADGMDALGDNDASTFAERMEEARRLDPTNIYFPNLQACVLADVGAYPNWFFGADPGPNHLDRALRLFRDSLSVDPGQELPHTHLAWHLLSVDPAESAKHFRAAAALIPDKGRLYYGLARALVAQKRPAQAAAAMAMETVNDPAFVAAPEWVEFEAIPNLATQARQLAATQLERIASTADPADRLGYARQARYAAALLRWLGGDNNALPAALALAEPEQQAILQWLSGRPAPDLTEQDHPWMTLVLAAADPAAAPQILARDSRRRSQPLADNRELIRALQSSDRRSLLLRTSDSPAIPVPRSYRERIAYGLLLRNVDGPPPRDPYIVPSNRLVRDFLGPLFPEKGFLPAPVLTRTMAELGLSDDH